MMKTASKTLHLQVQINNLVLHREYPCSKLKLSIINSQKILLSLEKYLMLTLIQVLMNTPVENIKHKVISIQRHRESMLKRYNTISSFYQILMQIRETIIRVQ